MAKKVVLGFLLGALLGVSSVFALDKLDAAIKKAADYILENAPSDTVIAIVQITSDSERLSVYILDEFPNYTVDNSKSQRKGLSFVDRGTMLALTKKELNFQYSGEVSEDEMVSLGERAGAQVIAGGRITEKGNNFSLNIKLTDVRTAKLLGSKSFDIAADDDMLSYVENSAIEQRRIAAGEKKEAEQKVKANRQAAAVARTKNTLGIFSNGGYVGYIYSPGLPIGFSLGSIRDTVGLFADAQFDTSFEQWDAIFGLNIRVIPSLLWLSAGGGVFSDVDGDITGAVSAGAYVKVWHFYGSVKYRYLFGSDFDASDILDVNRLDIGVGYVWKSF